MRFLFLFLSLFLTVPAFAQDADTLCNVIAAYKSDDANYKPGVDVHGKPVVSADLNSNLKPVIDPVVIPISIDLAQKFNLDLPDGMELKPDVAYVKIYGDGRVEYNDTDITQNTTALCSRARSVQTRQAPLPVPAQQENMAKETQKVPEFAKPETPPHLEPAREAAPATPGQKEEVVAPEPASASVPDEQKVDGQPAPASVLSPADYGEPIEGQAQ